MQVERNTQMKRDELNELDAAREWQADAAKATPALCPVIDLSLAGKGNYVRQVSRLTEALWFVVEACVINNKLVPFSALRVTLLRWFGAKIGPNCRFVHPLRIKAPWNLEVGANSWFGVDAWIYNQALIRIGSNVCISQGVFLTAGSHDYATNMDLRVDSVEMRRADGRDDRPFCARDAAFGGASIAGGQRCLWRQSGAIYQAAVCATTRAVMRDSAHRCSQSA
jgi:putative colanic acid biosynthesis acetyltransferase WcaF